MKEKHDILKSSGLIDLKNSESSHNILHEIKNISQNVQDQITQFVFHIFVRCVDYAEDTNQ
jgi:hypothetical protein